MRLLASSSNLTEFTINEGGVRKRGKDGTFSVPDSLGKSMVKSSEWAAVGTNFRSAPGWECQDCHRVNVFRDRCGKCGSTNLRPES